MKLTALTIVRLTTAFARKAAELTGASFSRNDFLEAIFHERPDLQGQKVRFPTQGVMTHTAFIGDEVFKGPFWKKGFFSKSSKDMERLQQLEGKGFTVIPEIAYVGKEADFFSMKLMPGIPLGRCIKNFTQEEKRNIAKDVAGFIIDTALAVPDKNGRYARHADLHPDNILVDPQTKKLTAIIDFGAFEYRSKKKLGRPSLRVRFFCAGSGLTKMIREEYELRKTEIPDSPAVKNGLFHHKHLLRNRSVS